MNRRPTLLLVQPSILPPGGGNSVAVWAIEALRDDFDITLLCWDPVDFDRINRYYGTTLDRSHMRVCLTSRLAYFLRRAAGVRAALLQRYLMHRWARPIAGRYDVVLSVNNEIDVGVPSIQYIHFPWGYLPRPDADLRWYHRVPGVLRLYYAAGALLAPVSASGVARNLTLVNSDWTGGKFREKYGGKTVTLYPPVSGAPNPPRWEDREDAIAVVGRIAPEKRLETAIAIVDRVRARGHALSMRVIGSSDNGSYLRKIRRLARGRPWLTLHENVSRSECFALISPCRYGLHAMADEHFGIAVAEMTASGSIVFVPRDGGQMEVVASDERLVYVSVDDGAAKIVRVLEDRALQNDLQSFLKERAKLFSWPMFRRHLRELVAGFANSRR